MTTPEVREVLEHPERQAAAEAREVLEHREISVKFLKNVVYILM